MRAKDYSRGVDDYQMCKHRWQIPAIWCLLYHPPMKHRRAEFSMDSTLNHDYNLKHLSAFGGYKSGHLDSVEMFEDEWMYLGRHLQEPKSKVAIVSLPSGLIKENC